MSTEVESTRTSEEELHTSCGAAIVLVDAMERVIRGKRRFLEQLVTCLAAGGHVLIEDVPGLGKTTVAKTLARLVLAGTDGERLTFRRIQFTPDLLPYDITGVDIYEPEARTFAFAPGPVFANIVLADEINRTTPKVQSALLEVMAERQVTVGNRTHAIDPVFFVIATQNPVETEGTYPLPRAQIDRFLMRLSIGYPDSDTEFSIVKEDPSVEVMPSLDPVCGKADILRMQAAARTVHCDDRLIRTAVAIAETTRVHRGVELGVSPRGSLMLIQACRAYALIQGRSYVIDQDLVDLAPLVLAHRLKLADAKSDAGALIREVALARLEELAY